MLRTLVTAFHRAGRQVGNTDSGVGGVNVLTARAGRTKRIQCADPPVNIRQLGFGSSGITATVQAEVWIRPCISSRRNTLRGVRRTQISVGHTRVAADFGDDITTAMLAFAHARSLHAPAARFRHQRLYMRNRSPANSAASSPRCRREEQERVSFIVGSSAAAVPGNCCSSSFFSFRFAQRKFKHPARHFLAFQDRRASSG